MKKFVKIRYELVYADLSTGKQQEQSYIPTLKEALIRKTRYYGESAYINRVTEFWKDDTCVRITREKIKAHQNIIEQGSQILIYPKNRIITVQEVFLNKDNELCFTGRFNDNEVLHEYILNKKDKVFPK